jgi:hypothetical protein
VPSKRALAGPETKSKVTRSPETVPLTVPDAAQEVPEIDIAPLTVCWFWIKLKTMSPRVLSCGLLQAPDQSPAMDAGGGARRRIAAAAASGRKRYRTGRYNHPTGDQQGGPTQPAGADRG